MSRIRITKGGRGPIGVRVRAKTGHYVHKRTASPSSFSQIRTIKRGGKLIRIGKSKSTGKWKAQSVLTPIKRKKR